MSRGLIGRAGYMAPRKIFKARCIVYVIKTKCDPDDNCQLEISGMYEYTESIVAVTVYFIPLYERTAEQAKRHEAETRLPSRIHWPLAMTVA